MLSAKPWRGEAVAVFCATQLASLCLGLAVAGLLQKAGLPAFRDPDGFGLILFSTLSFQGVTWLLIGFFLRSHQTSWREAFGFSQAQWWRVLLAALVVVLVILPVAWSLQGLSAMALEKAGLTPEDQTAVKLLSAANTWWTQVYLCVFTVVIAPVAEEFIFRGVLFPFVRQLGYPRLAWIGVSLLFALIHMDLAIVVPLFVLALALTWLYELTDNLLAPIAAHSLFNTANLLVLYYAEPLDRFLQNFSQIIHERI